MKRIITQLNSSKLYTCTNTVMPASIELSNYYFIKCPTSAVLMYYAVLITGGTYRALVTPS